MEELKVKYNELLERYKKGSEYIVSNPKSKDIEKSKELLEEISKEMGRVLEQIPNATDKEINDGFEIPESISVDNVVEVLENELKEEPVENVSQETKIVQVQPTQQASALQSFTDDWKIANQLAKSDIIPDNYKGKPQNVIIAVGLANQMNLPPFTVMQNLAIIKGKTSWSGSFAKTLIERTGKFKNLELNYIGKKGEDSYGCYLSAVRVSDGKVINGPEVTMKMAKDEGWTSNKKWLTLTDLMLAYRCQSFFCRLHCPEAMNGIYTSEEIEDITPNREQPVDVL